MGLDILLYADCQFRGKRVNISPLTENPLDGSLVVKPILYGRRNLYDALQGAYDGRLTEEDVKELPPRLKDALFDGINAEELSECIEEGDFVFYDYGQIKAKLNGGSAFEPLYNGYVYKKTVTQFEKGLIDEIAYYLTPEEYLALPQNKKKYYRFYAWDEWDSPYGYYRAIVRRVADQFEIFRDGTREKHWSDINYKEFEEAYKSIRIIALLSF